MLEAIKDNYFKSAFSPDGNTPNINIVQANPYVSIRRFLNYLDEVRLVVQGENPFADKDILLDSLGPAILEIYRLLDVFILEEHKGRLTTAQQTQKETQYQQDHKELKKIIESYLNNFTNGKQ